MSTWDLPRLRALRLKEPSFNSSSRDNFDTHVAFYPPDSDCYALFGYIPVRGIQNEDERYVNRLVLDFKEAKVAAVSAIATLVQEAFESEPFWLERTGFRGYAVAAPSSKVGSGSEGVNQMLQRIAQPFHSKRSEDLTLCPFSLYRVSALQTPSHQQKKSAADHLETIEVTQSSTDPLLADKLWSIDPAGPRVIVFDDVYTRGETYSACRELLENYMTEHSSGYEATPYVAGFFIARTWARNLQF